MQRFYLATTISDDRIIITDPGQVHHIRDVLRMREGERLIVCNGTGKEYVAEVETVGKDSVKTKVIAVNLIDDTNSKLTIACALPKLGRMDEIVDALTQLGVDTIIPMVTERTIVRLDEAGIKSRLARWRKIAAAAAMQSQRSTIPEIKQVSPFDEVLKQSSQYDLRLVAALCTASIPILDAVSMAREGHTIALIGPEGDFTPQEVEAAVEAGFAPVSLGKNVLRVATAATVTAACVILFRARGARSGCTRF